MTNALCNSTAVYTNEINFHPTAVVSDGAISWRFLFKIKSIKHFTVGWSDKPLKWSKVKGWSLFNLVASICQSLAPRATSLWQAHYFFNNHISQHNFSVRHEKNFWVGKILVQMIMISTSRCVSADARSICFFWHLCFYFFQFFVCFKNYEPQWLFFLISLVMSESVRCYRYFYLASSLCKSNLSLTLDCRK